MKLFAKYNRINLLTTIIIFVLSSITFYFLVRFIFMDEVDDDLTIEQQEIESYVKEHTRLPEAMPVRGQTIQYTEVMQPLTKSKFETTTLYDSLERKRRPCRILVFGIETNSKHYQITVIKSLVGTDALINSILLIIFVTILLILTASLIINRFLLKRLWKPFYSTLNNVKNFKLDNKDHLHFEPSNIDEFDFMNRTLEKTTFQAQQDYSLLKEFTENASHEMQTPLAIIRSKLDLLIQDENLSEDQSNTVQSGYRAIEKLSRLNQSLLLLAKIENNQYADTSVINLKKKIDEKIEAFRELWQNQEIEVQTILNPVTVKMNSELVDILLNNLLSNATKHNFPEGFIKIQLNEQQLTITNSSHQKGIDTARLYTRFYKHGHGQSQNGLGLSIIKQICDASGFRIDYLFSNQEHSFVITFNN